MKMMDELFDNKVCSNIQCKGRQQWIRRVLLLLH